MSQWHGSGPDVSGATLEQIIDARVRALLKDGVIRQEVAARSMPANKITPSQTDGQILKSLGGVAVWGAAPAGGGGTAATTTFTPAGAISATDVQAAIVELDNEKQPLDSDLTAIAAIAPANDDVIQRKAGSWINRTIAQLKADFALAKGDVGLGNVDNTSDVNKPVSTLQAAAIALKLSLTGGVLTGNTRVQGGSFNVGLTTSGGLTMGGLAGAVDWSLARASAGVAQLGVGNKLQDTTDPSSADDLSRKGYVDTQVGLRLPLTGGTLTGAMTVQPPGAGVQRATFTQFGLNAFALSTDTQPTAQLLNTGLALGVGGTTATDWSLSWLSSNVAQLGAGNFLRVQADPVNGNDLTRLSWVNTQLGLKASLGGAAFTGPVTVPTAGSSTAPYQKQEVDTLLAAKASASALASYLPLAGGTMSGGITMTGGTFATSGAGSPISSAPGSSVHGFLATIAGNAVGFRARPTGGAWAFATNPNSLGIGDAEALAITAGGTIQFASGVNGSSTVDASIARTGAGILTITGKLQQATAASVGADLVNKTYADATYAAIAHSHAFSAITGLLGIAQISATGTPSASSYLRGDGTWATVNALPAMTAGQVIYGVGTVPTAGSPTAAGLADLSTAQTIAGTKTFTSAILVNMGTNRLSITDTGISERAGTSGATASMWSIGDTGLTFGGSAGGFDFQLAYSAATLGVLTLATGNKIRDTSDPVNANDLARKAYVDSKALPAMTAGQVIYGVGTVPTAGSPTAAGLMDLASAQTVAGAKTFNGNVVLGPAATLQSVSGTITTYLNYSGYSIWDTAANLISSMGPGGFYLGSFTGGIDWTISRAAAGVATLGAGNQLRVPQDPVNANDLARKSYVDTATGNASVNRPSCRAYRSAPLPVSVANTPYAVPFDVEMHDTDNMHSTATNPERFYATATGLHQINAAVGIGSTAAAFYWQLIVTRYNAAGVAQDSSYREDWPAAKPSASYISASISTSMQANAGDYFTVTVQTNTAGLTFYAGATKLTYMDVAWVGGTGAAWGNAVGRATRTAPQVITNAAWNDVTFDTSNIAVGVTVAASTVPLTCLTPGTYSFVGHTAWAVTSAVGERGVRVIHKNQAGTIINVYADLRNAGASGNADQSVSDVITMSAGDFLQLQVFQQSGGPLNTASASGQAPSISMTRTGYQANPVLVPQLLHDHARPQWSATSVRTTSFVCPANASMLYLQMTDLGHANASGVWDMHFYVGTTSGGSDLFSLGGSNGWLGAGAGTGCMYPFNGSYCIPVTPAMRGATLYLTSSAPVGNYYLSGNIKMLAL